MIACFHTLGNFPDESERLKISVMYGASIGEHFFSSHVGIGSESDSFVDDEWMMNCSSGQYIFDTDVLKFRQWRRRIVYNINLITSCCCSIMNICNSTFPHITVVRCRKCCFGLTFSPSKVLTPWTPSYFLQNSCRRWLNIRHTTSRRRLNFRKLSPGARRFFESEKRRDPSRAFIPLTK